MATLRRKHPNDHLGSHSRVLTCASFVRTEHALLPHGFGLLYHLRNAHFRLLAVPCKTSCLRVSFLVYMDRSQQLRILAYCSTYTRTIH
jgi:hypothetical protein